MSSYGPRDDAALDSSHRVLSAHRNQPGYVKHATELSSRHRPILRYLGRTVHSIAIALLPSFVLHRYNPRKSSEPLHRLNQTSALDGLRGWASLSVFNFHVLRYYYPLVHYGYGLPPADLSTCLGIPNVNDRNDRIIQLPIIRLLFSGTAPVSVFFITRLRARPQAIEAISTETLDRNLHPYRLWYTKARLATLPAHHRHHLFQDGDVPFWMVAVS